MPSCNELREHKRGGEVELALVGMRVREHTISNDQLHQFLATLKLPVLGYLRDTQNYVHAGRARPDAVGRGAQPRRARPGTVAAPGRHGSNAMIHYRQPGRACSALVGQEIARRATGSPSTRRRIDQFAEATGDHQWIHVDPVRAAAGPFGTTIAHGFLTLSLLPRLAESAIEHRRRAHGRQLRPEPRALPGAGARRAAACAAHCKLLAYEPIDGGAQLTMEVTMEREGSDKPACVAESVSRRYV